MVKIHIKIFLLILLLSIFYSLSACNVDILGFIYSNDLDERLAERDNFIFPPDEQRTLSLGEDYSFIVLTDTHIEEGNAFTQIEDGDAFGLEALRDVIKNNEKIKFVVVLGDISQNGAEKDINKFIDIANYFAVPCYPVIGNHDIYFNRWYVWKSLIGSTRYRINGDTATLFILDSANAFFGKEQLDWLQKELKNTSGRVFVFTHSNLFVNDPLDIQQLSDVNERARITSILRNKCDIMFMGHSHERRINEVGNVQYVNIEDFKGTKVYCLVSVTSAGVTYTFEKLQ